MTHSRSSAAEHYFTCLTAHFFAGLIYACNYTPGATIGWICNWIQMVFCSTRVTADRYLLVRKLTSLLSHGTATKFLFFYFFLKKFCQALTFDVDSEELNIDVTWNVCAALKFKLCRILRSRRISQCQALSCSCNETSFLPTRKSLISEKSKSF